SQAEASDPDEGVAYNAAVQAGVLSGEDWLRDDDPLDNDPLSVTMTLLTMTYSITTYLTTTPSPLGSA
ncbi:78 kDa glucose-regulated protein homolog, partial [Elysia marginata]